MSWQFVLHYGNKYKVWFIKIKTYVIQGWHVFMVVYEQGGLLTVTNLKQQEVLINNDTSYRVVLPAYLAADV